MSSLLAHYSADDIEARIIAGLRNAGLNPEQRLDPAKIAALDHFHTGGLQSSIELLEIADIGVEDYVLDVGAGLAGCARLMASMKGCRVDCIELSPDYCSGASLLNRLTGLEDLIAVHQGSALALPFADATFDVVWMQNVGMNIEDKRGLYREIHRVLKPGGRYAMQEIAAGKLPTAYYPLPWATIPEDNHLATIDEMRSLLSGIGFDQELFEDISAHDFSTNVSNATPAGQGELGLGVYVDDLGTKASNASRSMKEGMVHLIRGLYRKPVSAA